MNETTFRYIVVIIILSLHILVLRSQNDMTRWHILTAPTRNILTYLLTYFTFCALYSLLLIVNSASPSKPWTSKSGICTVKLSQLKCCARQRALVLTNNNNYVERVLVLSAWRSSTWLTTTTWRWNARSVWSCWWCWTDRPTSTPTTPPTRRRCVSTCVSTRTSTTRQTTGSTNCSTRCQLKVYSSTTSIPIMMFNFSPTKVAAIYEDVPFLGNVQLQWLWTHFNFTYLLL